MLISLAPQHIQSDSMFLRIQLAVISSLLPEEFCMGVGWQGAWSWRERERDRKRKRERDLGGGMVRLCQSESNGRIRVSLLSYI